VPPFSNRVLKIEYSLFLKIKIYFQMSHIYYLFINHTRSAIYLTEKDARENIGVRILEAVLKFSWDLQDTIELYSYDGINNNYIRDLIIDANYETDHPMWFLNEVEFTEYIHISSDEDDTHDY